MKTTNLSLLTAALCTGALQAGTTMAPSGKAMVAPAPASPACSPDISYTNIGASYIHGWSDDNLIGDADGVGIDFSFELVPHFYIRGTSAWLNNDVAGFDTDLYAAEFGAGYAFPILSNLHFVLAAGGAYDYITTKDHGHSDDFGWYVFPHFRAKFACLEIHAGAKYTDIHDDPAWEGVVKFYYPIAGQLDLALGGTFAEDTQNLEVGLRYRF